eukprot:5605318-Karenia_brevis.AAC.1
MIPGTSVAAEESAACTNGSAASLTLLWPRDLLATSWTQRWLIDDSSPNSQAYAGHEFIGWDALSVCRIQRPHPIVTHASITQLVEPAHV